MKNFWKNKKVLVTGAAGFIGSHSVRALLKKGSIVTAVVSRKVNKKRVDLTLGNFLDKITLVKADLLDFKECLKITQGQEILLNFAAMDGSSIFKQKYPAQIFKVNTEIVLNILEASVINKIDRLLLMSSVEIYPKKVKSPIKEEYSLKENFQENANGYTWSKRFGEIAAKMYAKEYGLQIAIARAGNVYGPYDYGNSEKGRVIPTFINQVLEDKDITILGGGLQQKSFLYIEDFVKGVLDLTELYAVCDPVNIASKQYISIKDLSFLVKDIVRENEVKLKKSLSKDRMISTKKAEAVIAFSEQFSLEEGLRKTIDYFRINS